MTDTVANKILSVYPDSPAAEAGIRPGDELLSINGNAINDEIDLTFYAADTTDELEVVIRRRGRLIHVSIPLDEQQWLGIELQSFKIKTCKNHCPFCFVSQLPRGLRRTLYIKDEDYRMSFLYGGYITLTNLTPEEKTRIVQQRLSPLYVSVHTTDNALSQHLLGNPDSVDILGEIGFFASNRITLHTQIVLCPGLNDGQNLRRTISDLAGFFPYVESIAVVPVGLTAHGKKRVNPVTRADAQNALDLIGRLQGEFLNRHGQVIVYAADELYLRAEVDIPPLSHYGELPQVENGVGLIASFLDGAQGFEGLRRTPKRTAATFTAMSFYPFLRDFARTLHEKTTYNLRVVPVENKFFGTSVTVTGLLTGGDVINALGNQIKKGEVLLIPDIVLRAAGDVFLDDVTVAGIGDALRVRAEVIESTFDGLITALEELR
ncbi:DUF512 domain-containing protein [Candidatus Magnetobacterium casense]|uniref:DUF512 domain-containing protein n=1 Tax=Candidatus Magnetobacterium casense TaxID=1455061 RepID=A0ABS6S0A1_9BACT|nr:DUF512 domain-containing protein [Candidatus Magnetobacterium casensis]MBV6342246.1 DUF512 domain-containing protein [Candidatus Magnetobacterium casensis]